MDTRSVLTGALVFATLGSLAGTVAGRDAEQVLITTGVAPALLEVDLGTTVTWRNEDDERHRVRSKDGPVRFDSENLDPDTTFSFTFTVEGSYPYYDHRDRDDAAYFGMIVVGGAVLEPDAPLPDAGSVSIIDKAFGPAAIAIATGGHIEWSNDDGEAHTVTATDSTFDSGILNGGASFTQSFDTPGSYPYFCLIHPEMRGTITVSDPVSALEQAVPAPELGSALDSLGADVPAGASVSTVDRSFQPGSIEVVAGETVTWSNDDTEGHTVTADDGSFNSGIMSVGDEFSMTFDVAGTYSYFCAIHPEMTGAVTVVEAVSG